jgi:phospholipase/carboxylesterase
MREKQDDAEFRTRDIGQWVVRERRPKSDMINPAIVLIHGWTGDELSMWIFSSRLPRNAYLIAPRAPYRTPLGGFGWHEAEEDAVTGVDDFLPAVDQLMELLSVENFPEVDFGRLRLLGFSQGAALAYTFFLQKPQSILSMAALSGFLPDGADRLVTGKPLEGKRIFIAHGARDDKVAVWRARQAATLLQVAGAQVTYCEDDVGHKLSLNCFKGMEAFFEKEFNQSSEVL